MSAADCSCGVFAHGTGRVPADGGKPKGLSLGGVLPGLAGGVPTGAG